MRRLLPLLLLPAAAHAADKPARPAVSPRVLAEFRASDRNRDGSLSRAEVRQRVARMDVGRGRLAPAQVDMMTDAWFRRADANRDGKVSPAEMQRLLVAVARRYDANGDGVVSADEQRAAHAVTMGEVGKSRARER